MSTTFVWPLPVIRERRQTVHLETKSTTNEKSDVSRVVHGVGLCFVAGIFTPRGLRLGNLSAVQRAAAMHLLQVVLSPKGHQKVIDIMGSDQAPSEQSGKGL